MELTKFENPIAVEQLIFNVTPELIEKFIEEDFKIWTKYLETQEGFMGKDIWVNADKKGEVTTVVYWKSMECWKKISRKELDQTEEKFAEIMGKNNYKIIEANHNNQRFKVSEYRN